MSGGALSTMANQRDCMKVTNINGTIDNTCKCATWLDHWKNFGGGSPPIYCPELSCTERPEVGAHVQRANSTDQQWYIIPLCKGHNAKTGQTITISELVALVSANVSETCGKPAKPLFTSEA